MDEIKPENTQIDNDRISLRVVDQYGGEVFFKIKKTMPLGKLISAYCERKSVQANTVRFLFDGTRINDDMTPKSLNMEEDDVIDVMLQQTGGL